MSEVGSVQVKVNLDTSDLEKLLRIVAKHATACANELGFLRVEETLNAAVNATHPGLTVDALAEILSAHRNGEERV